MLHGIGGCTIAEAQRNLSYPEYLSWIRYFNKHGSINPANRIDRTLTIIAAHFSNWFGIKYKDGRKATRADFTLFPEKTKDIEATPDQVFAYLSTMAKPEED